MNVCTQIGRLGKDPEGFQYTPAAQARARAGDHVG
jgi:hypothetical protein